MTGKELAMSLLALPEDQQNLPVAIEHDYGYSWIDEISLEKGYKRAPDYYNQPTRETEAIVLK